MEKKTRTLRSNSTPTLKENLINHTPSPRSSIRSKSSNNYIPSIDEIRKVIREEMNEVIKTLKTEVESVRAEVSRVSDRLETMELTLSTFRTLKSVWKPRSRA